jgi:hypothetical protein
MIRNAQKWTFVTKKLLPETAPVLGDNDRVTRVLGIVLDAGGQTKPAGVKIHVRTKHGYILRTFVGDASHVVLIDDQLCPRLVGSAFYLMNIYYSAVRDPPTQVDTSAAFSLSLIR